MEFVYIGNPHARDDLKEVHMFGKVFPYNVPVKVENERFCQKLLGNSHFAVADGNKRYHSGATLATPKDNGPDRAGLMAQAKELGIEVDRRWSTDRIQKAIDERGA